MGICCANRETDHIIHTPEKINRVTFNDMRGFRKVNDINEYYEFGRKLGAGQFGTVFEGFHK